MTRARVSARRAQALAFAVLTLCLAAFAGTAAAQTRPKIAILGLEVEDKSGQAISEEATKVAKELTRALRSRADTPPTPYQLAPSSDKELIDEKLMNGCNDEATPCMAKIAENLKADYLLWGKIEKAKQGKEEGYKVNLTLLKVSTKQTSTAPGWLPNAQKGEAGVRTVAKDLYAKLSKGDAEGMLVIQANVERGTILVNGQPAGNITNSRGEISLAEDTYRIQISADGYKTAELTDVAVKAGETVNRSVDLVKADLRIEGGGTVSTAKSYTGWKVTAAAGLAVSAIAGSWWGYLYFSPISTYRNGPPAYAPGAPRDKDGLGSGDCDEHKDHAELPMGGTHTDYKNACKAFAQSKIAVGVTIGAAVVGGAALVYVLTRESDSPSEQRLTGRKSKRGKNIAITPIVSPEQAGATFRIDW